MVEKTDSVQWWQRHKRGQPCLCKDYCGGGGRGQQNVSGMGRGSGPRTSGPWPSSEMARNADAQDPISKNPEIGGSSKVERPEGCIGIKLVKGRRKILSEKEIISVYKEKSSADQSQDLGCVCVHACVCTCVSADKPLSL